MKTVLAIAPTTTPVSLAEVKTHLRVTETDEDGYITGLIGGAVGYVENVTGRKLITQTWKYLLDEWPRDAEMVLPFGGCSAVNSIKYKGQDGSEATWSADYYTVDTESIPGRVVIAYDASWPSEALYSVNPISVEFVTGYGAASAVPAGLKHAIKILVAHWFENRDIIVVGSSVDNNAVLPKTADALIWPYRLFGWAWFGGN